MIATCGSIYFACPRFVDYLPVRRGQLGEKASGGRRDALSLREQLNLPKGGRRLDYGVDQRERRRGFGKAAICSTARKRDAAERSSEHCAGVRENLSES